MTEYWLFGKHAVEAAIANPKRKIKKALFTKEAKQKLGKLSLNHEIVTSAVLQQHCKQQVHQGMALLVEPLEYQHVSDVEIIDGKPTTLLALDQVQDPHNVGAIIRSVAAFGIDGIILPEAHSPKESGVLAKAAAGAIEIVPIYYVSNLVQTLQQLQKKSFWVFGMDIEAENSLPIIKEYQRRIIVLGSEGDGMRHLTKQTCDLLVKIPMHPQMESLNVSNAAAITLYSLYNV